MREVEVRKLELDGTTPYVIIPEFLLSEPISELSDGALRCFLLMLAHDYGKIEKLEDGKSVLVCKGYCDIGKNKISLLMGTHERTVQRYITELEDRGYLLRKPRFVEAQRLSDRKALNLEMRERKDAFLRLLERLGLRTPRQNFVPPETNSPLSETKLAATPETIGVNTRGQNCLVNNNNTNNNNSNNTNSCIETQESSELSTMEIPSLTNQKDVDIADFLVDPATLTDFCSGEISDDTKSPTKSKKPAKSIVDKISSGVELKGNDLLEYFKLRYKETYGLNYPVSVKAKVQTISILNNSMLAKHPKEECIQIINDVIDNYKDAGLSTVDYPRPSIMSLSQEWLINKIHDYKQNVEAVKDAKAPSIESSAIVQGPYMKLIYSELEDSQKEYYLAIAGLGSQFSKFFDNGFVPDDIVSQVETKGIPQIKKEMMNLWKTLNP